jgi:preprotein translocase subunit SecB
VDTSREPGIRLSGIVVDRIRFDDVEVGNAPGRNLQFEFSLSRKLWTSPPSLDVTIALRISAPEPSTKFALEIAMTGRFEPIEQTPNLALQEFAAVNGPAIVMPFVREAVANITARSRNGIVLLPAVNVVALAQKQPEVVTVEDQ